MSRCRCIVVELPDGTRAIVRTAGGRPLTEKDRQALLEAAQAMREQSDGTPKTQV